LSIPSSIFPLIRFVVLLALGLAVARSSAAADLTVAAGGEVHRFSAAELLARPDAATISLPDDVSYGRPMTWRAVKLLALLPPGIAIDTLEARATDGFVSQIPFSLVQLGATAWIAVEDPERPWPDLPGKKLSAGPFYLVWEHPERASLGTEQWPYALAALTGVAAPSSRWPQLAVDPALPPDAPARRGQAVFAVQCLPCHRMRGGGAGEMGPDLGMPMPAARYLSPEGLRALIRDPRAVRSWPQQQMPGFDAAALPQPDLDALVAYLEHMAVR
jgi:mono/diheme cytochrome c family protein